MTIEPEIEILAMSVEEFTAPLRMLQGYDPASFERLYKALRSCVDRWAESTDIPKALANILVDLYPFIEACSLLYGDDEAGRVTKAADMVGDLVRECVQVDWNI